LELIQETLENNRTLGHNESFVGQPYNSQILEVGIGLPMKIAMVYICLPFPHLHGICFLKKRKSRALRKRIELSDDKHL
jgi:hypothetical protein